VAINFHPQLGQILICNYEASALGAEMIKARPCVVISPRLRRRNGLCTIVPLSTTPPQPPDAWHYLIRLERPLPKPFDSLEMWAKCDMIATVSFERLSPLKCGRDQYGKRKYLQINLLDQDITGIQNAIKAALGLFN